eukprot:SAG31_NODE_27730_length_421_cov_0.763975_1_plen_23_part_01
MRTQPVSLGNYLWLSYHDILLIL